MDKIYNPDQTPEETEEYLQTPKDNYYKQLFDIDKELSESIDSLEGYDRELGLQSPEEYGTMQQEEKDKEWESD